MKKIFRKGWARHSLIAMVKFFFTYSGGGDSEAEGMDTSNPSR